MNSLNSILESYYPYLAALAKNSRDYHDTLSRNDVMRFGKSLRELQRGLTGERALPGSGYLEISSTLAIYLLYYWPVSFVQTFCALYEIAQREELPSLHSVLDLGSGPGPNSFAALEFGAQKLTLADSSEKALKTALKLAERKFSNCSNFSISSADLEIMPDAAIPDAPAPYDLIIASHSMNELWKNENDALERRAALVKKAWQKLAPGGLLLIIEPSALVTSRPALLLRNQLLNSLPYATCVAPCPHSNSCPMLEKGESRTCHSTWVWTPPHLIEELARTAGLERDSVKATWYALRKAVDTHYSINTSHAVPEPHSACKINHSVDGLESPPLEQAPAQAPSFSGRIVSEPLLNKAGRIRYLLCTNSGLITISAARTDRNAEISGFFNLKRGDYVDFQGLSIRETPGNFGFSETTVMKVLMVAPKADGCLPGVRKP